MITSEHTSDVLQALLRAKLNFQPIVKSEVVKVTTKAGRSYSYRYAPLESIQAGTEAALAAEGLLIISGGQPGADGAVECVTRLFHAASQQWLESCLVWNDFDEIKTLGAFLSYARRFSTVALLDLTAEDDVDSALIDGDHVQRQTKAVSSSHGNGHATPAPEPEASAEHPTIAHMDALEQLVTVQCGADVEELHDRLRHTLGLKPGASTAKRLMVRVLSMEQYMQVFQHFTKVAEQLAKSRKETASGNAPKESAEAEPTPASTGESPADPPEDSAEASSSAPEADDAAERDRVRLRAEVANWDLRISSEEIEHTIQHNPYSKARALLWKCRRQDTAA